MNEISHISSSPLAEPAYKDRSTGLLVFGILTLILGCLVGLFVPLMFLGQVMAAQAPGAPSSNYTTILPMVALYGVLAVALIWLGIGSIKARRWARALLLIFSWAWLIMGVLMTVIMPFIMFQVFSSMPRDAKSGQSAMPQAAIIGMIVFMVLFLGVFFIALPALWTYFYGSRHVKATCEARDPVARWTDACPLPVLAISVWTWLSVPMMLVMALSGRAIVPFFGSFLSGLPGGLFYLLIAAVWGMAGWWLYRLDARGWWLILGAIAVFVVSSFLTYAHHDITEMYQLQGLPQEQIDHIQKMGLFTGNRMAWLMLLCSTPFLGYLLFIKRYLRKPTNPPV